MLRDLCDKLPAIEEVLEMVHDNCDDGAVAESQSKSVEPVLQQCEKNLKELHDIFRKACPKDKDDRSKRLWKSIMVTAFIGRESKVQKPLLVIQDDMKLLEQHEVCRIGDKLDDLQQLTEALARDDDGRYNHSGSGNIIANEGGTPTNYVVGGSNNRQINHPGVYNEGPSST